jgi:hypothetical protein
MCKCGREIAIKKTGECMKCYNHRKHVEKEDRTKAWRLKNGVKRYIPRCKWAK